MSLAPTEPMAPELSVSEWLNSNDPISLAGLRGEVVVIEAFQMLCPGCVTHGLPQVKRINQLFGADIAVLGLHTVFEHHAAMTPTSLEAFLYEYGVSFPVGVDQHEEGVDLPITMGRYQLRGTPSLMVIDRVGLLRARLFGQQDDLKLGAMLGRLIDEPKPANCSPEGCVVPPANDCGTMTS